jgi:large subunit ribosomal protein L9
MERNRIGGKMKVIFLEDVPNVASTGDVKKVADGYARNYLIPKKLAVLATAAELQKLESRRKSWERREASLEQEAEAFAQELAGVTVALKVRAGKEKIYGSVTNTAIAKELKKLVGRDIDKHTIQIEEPIKTLGSHEVAIKLTRNVTATVSVLVEPKEEAEKEPKQDKEQPDEQDKEIDAAEEKE